MKRKIITIDEQTCNGCGLCIPNCPEGAIQLIAGKARLISDLLCDGLGACIGHCPQGAITIEEREAVPYDERKTMENIIKAGMPVIQAHLRHLKDHGQTAYLSEALAVLREKNIVLPADAQPDKSGAPGGGCPGMRVRDLRPAGGAAPAVAAAGASSGALASELRQWPIQLKLVPAFAPYLQNADIVVAADCAPFAYADFHRAFLRDKILLILCPKLDQAQEQYVEKIKNIVQANTIKSITMLHMEVPCCFGLVSIVQQALQQSGQKIPARVVTISVQGQILEDTELAH